MSRHHHYQTCPCCGAPSVRVEHVPEDIRQYFALRYTRACMWCIRALRQDMAEVEACVAPYPKELAFCPER